MEMSEETISTEMDTNETTNETSKGSNTNAEDSVNLKSTESSANIDKVPIVDPHQHQSAEILKLVPDCFEELFEYLPLKDILCIGQTCQRLHEIVLFILEQYYSGAELLLLTANGLRIGNVDETSICSEFIESAHKISVFCNNGLNYLNQIQPQFRRLRHIHLFVAQINRRNVSGLKEIFEKLEVLQLSKCDISGSVHENILAFCPNVRRLGLMEWSFESDANEVDLFHHKYPSLEHFELISNEYKEPWFFNGLKDFLKLNPNIRSLSVPYWMNGKQLLPDYADIHLAELAISVNREIDEEFVQMIKELHQRSFYQRLKLYFTNSGLIQDNIDQLATLEGFSKLYLGRCACLHSIAISSLSSLNELSLYECDRITDLETAASNLSMLERIHFKFASLDDICPFIRQARRVKRIKVENLLEGTDFSIGSNVINLVALNKERKKLPNCVKVTIYVKEKVYLATKWALRETDYSAIRLKREESYEWIHDFE